MVNLFYILVVWEKRPIAFWLELLTNVNGFANGQPFLYIVDVIKKEIIWRQLNSTIPTVQSALIAVNILAMRNALAMAVYAEFVGE